MRRETTKAVERGEQHQLTNLLKDRVVKPRAFSNPKSSNQAKRLKPTKISEAPRAAPATQANEIVTQKEIESQKRKWRLAEILKKEREAKRKKQFIQPSFVLSPPHMDTRRPSTTIANKSSDTAVEKTKPGSAKKLKLSSTAEVLHAEPILLKKFSNSAPGGDALLYDRCMLPKSHALILDTLIALETAIALLRVRKMRPTIGAVRHIVERTTSRNFTVKVMSQLAHFVPEAVAVLPGPKATFDPKSPSNNLIIRLDEVDEKKYNLEDGKDVITAGTTSQLGENFARVRRSLLHRRLLQHIREDHGKFLAQISATRYKGDVWHPDFDLEKDVSEIAAPPMYKNENCRAHVRNTKKVRFANPISHQSEKSEKKKEDGLDGDAKGEGSESDEDDSCIPKSLLLRVRARCDSQKKQEAKLEDEKTTNESFLSKLTCTMDSVCMVMRGERRSAMGWNQLLMKLEKVHPKKWKKDDLERQLDAVSHLGSEWCKKVELKSSRGGYAFRIVSESAFSRARASVNSATASSLGDL